MEELDSSVDKQELDYEVKVIKRSNKFINCRCRKCGHEFHADIPNDLKENIQYGKNVTFYYSDHTNEEYHEEVNSAFEFITKLLRHLLPEHFKSIRSYGFHNKASKLCDNIKYVISKEKGRIKRDLLKWKNLILTSFNRIPIICPFAEK